jgi:hypothetical protein
MPKVRRTLCCMCAEGLSFAPRHINPYRPAAALSPSYVGGGLPHARQPKARSEFVTRVLGACKGRHHHFLVKQWGL